MKCILAILLFPALAAAQSPKVIERLREEPASLFDIGLMRLERVSDLVESTIHWKEGTSQGINSSYSRDKNKFFVHYWVMDDLSTQEQMHSRCKYAIDQMAVFVSKSVPGIFQHAETPNYPGWREDFQQLRDELLPMFELGCIVYGPSGTDERRFRAKFTFAKNEMEIVPLDYVPK